MVWKRTYIFCLCSLLAIGALCGSLSAVFLMDAVGRKTSLLAFSVMSLFIGLALSWQHLGRFFRLGSRDGDQRFASIHIRDNQSRFKRYLWLVSSGFIVTFCFKIIMGCWHIIFLYYGKNSSLELAQSSILPLPCTIHLRSLLHTRESSMVSVY